jgi:hypothetical protein
VTRPRAADDFAVIHQRVKELRGDGAVAPPAGPRRPAPAETAASEHERRLKDRREGLPPPWVPTIFVKKPTRSEVARRFWHARSGW